MSVLHANQRLEILRGSKQNFERFHSKIYSLTDKAITLENNDYRVTHLPLEIGESITVQFTQPDSLYEFETTVISKFTDPKELIIIRRTDASIRRGQRRQFFRVDARIRVALMYKIKVDGEDVKIYDKSFTKNISGGGIYCKLDNNLALNTDLVIEIFLPDSEASIETKGKIVRKNKASKNENIFNYGIHFIDIRDADRARIIQYLNLLQSRLKNLEE